jgi:site-specific recombinase XerD
MEETGEPPKPPKGKESVKQLAEKFLANMRDESKDPETIRKYRYLFAKLQAFADDKGIRFVSEFDLPTLADFRGTWKVGDSTRQKEQERLRAIFRFAQSHKMSEHNPAADLGKIKVKHRQKAPFTDDEIAAIEKTAMSRINDEKRTRAERERSKLAYALILLMRSTGLRISDAAMLEISGVVKDGKKNRISLRTQKTDTLVEILVGEPVVAALRSFTPATKTHFFWDGQLEVKPLTNLYRDFYLKRGCPAFS